MTKNARLLCDSHWETVFFAKSNTKFVAVSADQNEPAQRDLDTLIESTAVNSYKHSASTLYLITYYHLLMEIHPTIFVLNVQKYRKLSSIYPWMQNRTIASWVDITQSISVED